VAGSSLARFAVHFGRFCCFAFFYTNETKVTIWKRWRVRVPVFSFIILKTRVLISRSLFSMKVAYLALSLLAIESLTVGGGKDACQVRYESKDRLLYVSSVFDVS